MPESYFYHIAEYVFLDQPITANYDEQSFLL